MAEIPSGLAVPSAPTFGWHEPVGALAVVSTSLIMLAMQFILCSAVAQHLPRQLT